MINLFWPLLKLKYFARRLLSAALVSAIIVGSFPVGILEVRAALPQGEKEPLFGQAGGDYLWQSLEVGDLGGIENTSQYAGWRFSVLKDAYVTELCGYFKGVYSVNLYDGAYNLKASSQIAGYEQWNCASIAPIAVSKGEKYYVVAEILNSPVYYRSGASMLPRQNKEAIIESGITQRIDQPFGSDMKSDDGRIFGIVDVKITPKREAEILIKKAGASLSLIHI